MSSGDLSSGGRFQGVRVSLIGLRLGMLGVWMAVVGISALVLTALILYMGLPTFYIYGVIGMVVLLNVVQWLFGPYIINSVYRVKEADRVDHAWLYSAVEQLAAKSGLRRTPKIGIAEIEVPNAFAYGSPLTGPMVAVTKELLNRMPRDEVEAVLAHEVGHLKHRDVVVMLMISLLPAVIYYVGMTLYYSGLFGGDRRNGGSAYPVLMGMGLIALSFIFNIFVFYMSRIREYFADTHAALTVDRGAKKLQRGLVRIMTLSGRIRPEKRHEAATLKMFFITDPERAIEGGVDIDQTIEALMRAKPSVWSDLFSTHPNPAKRIQHLAKFT
ncbi:MAG: zinc metalloprotease HtpX [Aigarchaeota archaeon]|nr:zinc metalloprotease HtpX [Aigarchaeota archaeon]MDW8092214.1 zinc metalloprotease HtpX [Nitrososphaerota archaeon]